MRPYIQTADEHKFPHLYACVLFIEMEWNEIEWWNNANQVYADTYGFINYKSLNAIAMSVSRKLNHHLFAGKKLLKLKVPVLATKLIVCSAFTEELLLILPLSAENQQVSPINGSAIVLKSIQWNALATVQLFRLGAN